METSCGRERLSRVRSSSKSLATFIISVAEGDSPVDRTCVYVSLESDFFVEERSIHLAEEFLERVTADNVGVCLET